MSDFKTLVFSGLIIALVGPSSAEDSRHYWILEAATPVRSQPKAKGEVKTYLQTGTDFYAAKRSGDLIYVDRDYVGNVLRGWVPASMVSEAKVDSVLLQKQLRQARSNTDSIRWLERLASLRPEGPDHLMGLQKAYAASGDTAKAAHYGRELRGTNPIYLARHDGEDVLVFGSIDSTGGFRNLLWYEVQSDSDISKFAVANDSSRAIKKKALALRGAFASMAWYGCGSNDVPGSRLRRVIVPKVVPDTKKTGKFNMSADGWATFGVSLGSSTYFHRNEWAEAIYATRPAYHVPDSGIKGPPEWDSLAGFRKQLVGTLFDSNGIAELEYSALPEYGHVDIRMRGFPKGSNTAFEQRGIFDGRNKLVWPPKGQTTFEGEEIPGKVHARPLWFRFGPAASFPAFIVLPFSTQYRPPYFQESEDGISGYQLLRIDGKGLKAFTFRTEFGGC